MIAALINIAIVIASIAATELLAIWVHRDLMHGRGWAWHESHHAPRKGFFEKNDLYAAVFSVFAMGLFIAGSTLTPILTYVAIGMTIYGALYALVHDGLVHERLPVRFTPRRGYLKRLVQAHRLHHATRGRDGAVSFGFLWAPPVASLKQRLKAAQTGRR